MRIGCLNMKLSVLILIRKKENRNNKHTPLQTNNERKKKILTKHRNQEDQTGKTEVKECEQGRERTTN